MEYHWNVDCSTYFMMIIYGNNMNINDALNQSVYPNSRRLFDPLPYQLLSLRNAIHMTPPILGMLH